MEEPILSGASELLAEYVGTKGTHVVPMDLGRLDVCLQIETTRRILQALPGSSLLALSREEICTVLTTLIKNAGMTEMTFEWYERLLRFSEEKTAKFAEAHGIFPVAGHASLSEVPPHGGAPDEGNELWPGEQRIADPDAAA
jgi:hypothetical protein